MSGVSRYGRRLKAFREWRGLSRNELAKRSGVPAPTIFSVEKGRQANMSIENWEKIAIALQVTIDQLVREDPWDSGFAAAIA